MKGEDLLAWRGIWKKLILCLLNYILVYSFVAKYCDDTKLSDDNAQDSFYKTQMIIKVDPVLLRFILTHTSLILITQIYRTSLFHEVN